ncbi:major facilitator superfamily transporter [Seiridium cupressi]
MQAVSLDVLLLCEETLEGVICLEDHYRGLSFVENRRAALSLKTFQADARAQGNGDAASPSIQTEDDGRDNDKHKNEYITGFRLSMIMITANLSTLIAALDLAFLHLDLLGFALFLSSISNFQFMFYLPLYFQSIQDTSAIKSGVYSLPIVALFAVGLTFHSIISGGVVRKTRLLQPVELAGALFATLCAGLLYGLSPNSSKAWYIGAHIRLGFGIGLANQVPITALQSFAKPEDLGFTMGIAFMAQPVAGRPSLDVGQVLFTGASEIRTVYSGADVDAILDAYMGGIKDVYNFSLASRSSFRCAVVLRHPIQKVGEL